MPKNKKNHPTLEELLERPWCYYCERDFEDLKILIDHQRHKHFKCEQCGRRLNTAGGLSVHLNHVHKETLGAIENALPNRSSHDIEIFGIEGIPADVVEAHKQRVISTYAQAEAERRAASGNQGGGTSGGAAGNPNKKPKTESISEMKKRLAEHKAKKAAEEAAASASPGNGTPQPMDGMDGQQAVYMQGSAPPPQGVYPGPQGPYNGAAMYGAPPQHYLGPPNPAYPQQLPFQPPGPAFQAQPPGPAFQAQPSPFAPPNMQPLQHFPQAPYPQPYANGPTAYQGGPQHPFPPNNMMNSQGPPQGMPPAQRPNSISPAPGLPQRPSFSTPPVNASQMQQMHQGIIPNPPSGAFGSMHSPHAPPNGSNGATPGSMDQGQAEIAPPSSAGAPLTAGTENADKADGGEKKSKKDKEKDKDIRLVYSDNEVSPEEKMASLPRYAFNPTEHSQNGVPQAVAA